MLLRIKDFKIDLGIESQMDLTWNTPQVADLLVALAAFNGAVALEKVKCIKDPVILFFYTLRYKAKDGRLWKQTLDFTDGIDPDMTFDVTDGWKLLEFSNARNVRAAIVALIIFYQCTLVECNWS